MGTAASHSSEEEEEGAEEGMEGAAGAPQAGAAAPALPPAEVLLEQARLREATARLREAALPEPLVSRHHSALVRWLEERLSRGDEAVSLEQFCEVLESVSRLAAGSRGESEEVKAAGKRGDRGTARAARNLGDRPVPAPATGRDSFQQTGLLRAPSSPALGSAGDGGSLRGSACPGRGVIGTGETSGCCWGPVSPGPGPWPSTRSWRARTRVLVRGEGQARRFCKAGKAAAAVDGQPVSFQIPL